MRAGSSAPGHPPVRGTCWSAACGLRGTWPAASGYLACGVRVPDLRRPRHARVRLSGFRASLDGLLADRHRTQTTTITIC